MAVEDYQITEFTQEVVTNVFLKVHKAVAKKLYDHFARPDYPDFDVYCYAHTDPVKIDTTIIPPCILLFGPNPTPTMGHLFNKTVDIGTDEIGHVRTRTYHNLSYFNLGYVFFYLAESMDQLLKAQEDFGIFSKRYKSIEISDLARSFRFRKYLDISPNNMRNNTNIIAGKAEFAIERVLVIDGDVYFDSGRVYSVIQESYAHETSQAS